MLKITIPFEIKKDTSDKENPLYWISGIDGGFGYYGTDSKAKKELRKIINRAVSESLKATQNNQAAYVFCNDGTVLRVGYYFNSWGYEISGPDRETTSGVFNSDVCFQLAIKNAKKHAEESYGGVLSVSR